MTRDDTSATAPTAPVDPGVAVSRLLDEGVVWGDTADWLERLPSESVDLFLTSPPYADARRYSEIHPDHYVEWFLPFAEAMFRATAQTGSFVLNIKNRVAASGALRGQRHPYVYELVLALQRMGWRWLETYIWSKPESTDWLLVSAGFWAGGGLGSRRVVGGVVWCVWACSARGAGVVRGCRRWVCVGASVPGCAV
ncbi:DNA methyltransferase [Candidatus Poriferisodalis sp.]|uniref:DNA methyltransferase n=1 Tax=Candidatus Poriferisodalis sp. TaxID=3101277 RepID=UPI003D095B1D